MVNLGGGSPKWLTIATEIKISIEYSTLQINGGDTGDRTWDLGVMNPSLTPVTLPYPT